MKSDASNSVSDSAAESRGPSPNARGAEQSAAQSSSQSPPPSEAEFLEQEAAKARAAINEALSDLGRNLKATVDPHMLTRDHPWIAISTAAVAGFAAALTLVPSKEQQALRALVELERARHGPPPSSASTTTARSDNSASAAGIVGTIAAEALKILRPLATTLLSAGIARASGGKADGAVANGPAAGNGHSGEDDISSPS
jgi:hypothetical protein